MSFHQEKQIQSDTILKYLQYELFLYDFLNILWFPQNFKCSQNLWIRLSKVYFSGIKDNSFLLKCRG